LVAGGLAAALLVGVVAAVGIMAEKRKKAAAAMNNRAQQMMVPLDREGTIIADPGATVEVYARSEWTRPGWGGGAGGWG
jgi:archaellum component FlaG (FlaF/FlaG flagellin family)